MTEPNITKRYTLTVNLDISASELAELGLTEAQLSEEVKAQISESIPGVITVIGGETVFIDSIELEDKE
jgi:hypothetical protein